MNGTSTRRVKAESGGKGVVAHVGLHALGAFADRLGLGVALSSAISCGGNGIPVHDRGKVLTQMALVLAGGGESCLDIEHLRIGGALFGSVPSDTTVARTFHEIDPGTRDGIAEAVAKVRTEVWRRSSATNGTDRVLLDIDASRVEVHSENKEQAEPTHKGGFGFHPMFCFADQTGETLAGLLRPGNAGANTVADHVTVLDAALAQLPDPISRSPTSRRMPPGWRPSPSQPTWCGGSSSSAQTAPGETRDPRRCDGPSSTRLADSCAAHAGTSCASSTAGRPPMCCSTPISASHCSPDHRQIPVSRHSLDDARSNASPGSDSTPPDGALTGQLVTASSRSPVEAETWPKSPQQNLANHGREELGLGRETHHRHSQHPRSVARPHPIAPCMSELRSNRTCCADQRPDTTLTGASAGVQNGTSCLAADAGR